ncbi:M43 family zinc metalloprotease [Aestuariivivens marinum]|uniref:M43 family zinc metalloprotease n=1 Tax=Aestuariivivens marinum TaxID=2913555 RepID=UPI001F5789BC|nr:M43 family zinc metalloprotease [Aestuariivivens marinum]
MKRTTLIFLWISIIAFTKTFGQIESKEPHLIRCGSVEYNKALLTEFPEMMGSDVFEDRLKQFTEAYKLQRSAASNKLAVITIPVVVHVLHNGEPIGDGPNLSEAQVLSQITVLNQDFRKLSGTRGDGGGVDTEIQFQLAKQDPSGCPTNGIDRVNIGQDGINESSQNDAQNQMNALKPSSIWDATVYLNIWTVKFRGGSGLLGYAQLPGGSVNTDGVVLDYKYFGTDDDPNVSLAGSYNLGRTTTHEVGHYLGLLHTWGDNWTEGDPDDNSCGDDDNIADTPNSGRPNYGCPQTIPDTCPGGDDDMIENYMDYSDDVCFDTFTDGQKTRMQGILGSTRSSLASSTKNNLVTGENNDAGVHVVMLETQGCSLNITPLVKITNWGDVPMTSASLSYNVDGGSNMVYNWSGNLAQGVEEEITLPVLVSTSGSHTFNISVAGVNGTSDQRICNDNSSSNFIIGDSYDSTTKVLLTLILDDYASETNWEFRDSSNNLLYSGNYISPQDNNKTVNEEFNVVSDECYTFTIFDSADDGICCGYGDGSYLLETDNNTPIASGGAFTDSETVSISTQTLSVNSFFTSNRIILYPNPTSDKLNIKLAYGNVLPEGYKIYNMLGQLVKQQTITNIDHLAMETTFLNKGMYFIKVYKQNEFITIPFVKK